MDGGMIGGIVGCVGGLAGGIIGTYFSIKNTNGPREKRFMVKSAVGCWVFLTLFLVLLFSITSPYKWLLWIPYGILLPVGIRYINKQQQQIRLQEENSPPDNQEPEENHQ